MFKKATRRKAKLKIALAGPSGSGKTASALLIAKGIGGKIAMIDTENDSASLYAGQEIAGQKMPDFDTLNLKPPYTTQAYARAMSEAVKAGYDVLIVDSVSHQWAGEGGVLNRKEALDQKPGSNSYTNWGKFTPEQEQFKSALLQFPLHLIVTMRSKQDYALVKEDGKKAEVKKLGMAPIQRDGMEYEFTSFIDIDISHNASSSKDRTGIFADAYFKITEDTGKALKAWLDSGDENAGNTGVSLDSLQGGAGAGGSPKTNTGPRPQPQQAQQNPPVQQQRAQVDKNRPLTAHELENINKTALGHLWSQGDFVTYMRRKYKTILAEKITLQQGIDFHNVVVSMTGQQALATVPAEELPAASQNAITPSQPSQAPPPEQNFGPPTDDAQHPHSFPAEELDGMNPPGEFDQFQGGAFAGGDVS